MESENEIFEQQPNGGSQTTSARKSTGIKWTSVALVVILAFFIIKYVVPKVNTSWATDKACAAVKSEVYSQYGEIPRVTGEIVYRKGEHYIVAVKYELPDLGWKASCACLIYGYRKSNCVVSGMTNELPYSCNYDSRVDELKVLWGLD